MDEPRVTFRVVEGDRRLVNPDSFSRRGNEGTSIGHIYVPVRVSLLHHVPTQTD